MTSFHSTPLYCITYNQWRVPTADGWYYLAPDEQADLNRAGRFALSYVVAYAISTGGAAGCPPDRPAHLSSNFTSVAVERPDVKAPVLVGTHEGKCQLMTPPTTPQH